MTDALIAYSRVKMQELELLGPGGPAEAPIGTIEIERVRDFFAQTVMAGLYKDGELKPEDAVTLQFVEPAIED
jgi:hypothetical protein